MSLYSGRHDQTGLGLTKMKAAVANFRKSATMMTTRKNTKESRLLWPEAVTSAHFQYSNTVKGIVWLDK